MAFLSPNAYQWHSNTEMGALACLKGTKADGFAFDRGKGRDSRYNANASFAADKDDRKLDHPEEW